MIRNIALALCLAALLGSAGCGKKNLIVLLPDPEGKVGQVEVTTTKGGQILDQPGQATKVAGADKKPGKPFAMSQKKIEKVFGQALAVHPTPSVNFILYLKPDSVELTEESALLIPKIIATIKERNSVDTSVVGHTDTAGSEEYNYRLSRQRAEEVARLLLEAGVDRSILEITSHGEKNQLVPTADDVSEPRNRRVEVTVR